MAGLEARVSPPNQSHVSSETASGARGPSFHLPREPRGGGLCRAQAWRPVKAKKRRQVLGPEPREPSHPCAPSELSAQNPGNAQPELTVPSAINALLLSFPVASVLHSKANAVPAWEHLSLVTCVETALPWALSRQTRSLSHSQEAEAGLPRNDLQGLWRLRLSFIHSQAPQPPCCVTSGKGMTLSAISFLVGRREEDGKAFVRVVGQMEL